MRSGKTLDAEHTVRRLLSQDVIPASDKRVQFVGLQEYVASGGPVRRDLFSQEEQDEEGTYLLDPAQLTRLASDKLAQTAAGLKAEGWKWVEVQPESDPAFIGKHRRLYPQPAPLSPAAEEEWEALSVERDKLENAADEKEESDNPEGDPTDTRLDEIEDRLIALDNTRCEGYSSEVKAASGILVTIGHDGSLQLIGGLLRKEDEAALATGDSEVPPTPRPLSQGKEEGDPAPYSASLIEALTAHKTAALAVELAAHPHIALAAVVHAHVLGHFGLDLRLYRKQTCLQLSFNRPYLGAAKDSPAYAELAQGEAAWLQVLPKEREALWHWCLEQDEATLLRLLAFCTAASLNAIQGKNDSEGGDRILHANALARALAIDMTRWFTPTAENFFDHVSKARITEALTEAGKAPDRTKLDGKKTQLAKVAESEMMGTGWLPAPVRIPPAPVTREDNPPLPAESQDKGEEGAGEERGAP